MKTPWIHEPKIWATFVEHVGMEDTLLIRHCFKQTEHPIRSRYKDFRAGFLACSESQLP